VKDPDQPYKRKYISITEAAQRIRRYCVYQERSHQEVRDKLFEFGLNADSVDELLTQMISEGFLNEVRFAKAFAGGKFRVKKWGRIKIQRALEQHGLTEACIRDGIKEIEEGDYLKTLIDLIQKKSETVHEENLFLKRDKIATYSISRGFEPELVWKTIKELLPMVRGKT
jgi:regulatory protein